MPRRRDAAPRHRRAADRDGRRRRRDRRRGCSARPTPAPTRRRRSSCSSTAARWAPGPAGRGAGTRTCSSSVATPCSCPTRPSRWATARRSSTAAGVAGASGRTPTSWPPSTARSSGPTWTPTRTALMGGSFGGYMANWVAGHTDRFRAIVTHASLWELTRLPRHDRRRHRLGAGVRRPVHRRARATGSSPRTPRSAAIRTPMLVIHGELDARVPVSEALRLWTDLHRHGVDAKFLYFPDEGHWVLKPQHAAGLVRDGAGLPRPARPRSRLGPPLAPVASPDGRPRAATVPAAGRPGTMPPHDATSRPPGSSPPRTSATTRRSSGATTSTRAWPTSGSSSMASRPRSSPGST